MDLQIIKIASDNKNQKTLKRFTHEIKNKNTICGDEITIKLLIKNKIIKEIGYNCKSCVFCQASMNLLCKKIIKLLFIFDIKSKTLNITSLKDNLIKSIINYK